MKRCILPITRPISNKPVNNNNIINPSLKFSVFGILLLMSTDVLNTKTILIILEPNIFPKTNSNSFFFAAVTDVANSGNDVPKATAVAPIIISDILKYFAIAIEPSINK